jgi:hypothetical protein
MQAPRHVWIQPGSYDGTRDIVFGLYSRHTTSGTAETSIQATGRSWLVDGVSGASGGLWTAYFLEKKQISKKSPWEMPKNNKIRFIDG